MSCIRASATGRPRIRSAASLAFRGGIRIYLDCAFASAIINYPFAAAGAAADFAEAAPFEAPDGPEAAAAASNIFLDP